MNRSSTATEAIARRWAERRLPISSSRLPIFLREGSRWKEKDVEIDGAESAGINRQEAEDENSSRERSSDPLGPEFCAVGREARREA